MPSYREVNIIAAHLLVMRGDELLFGRRVNTGFSDGMWHLPAGHLDAGESVTAAAIREAAEEIGIAIDALPGDVVEYPAVAINHVRKNEQFSMYGF